jgi:T-complex protein 1 subunit eta
MAQFGMQPGIILLREGTDTSQGKAQLVSNINACAAIADIVRTTLGPRGMDKLIHDGGKVTISNDGATLMKCLQVSHPAAKTLVDISLAQDAEVGDGTTSVVVLATEFLQQVKTFVEDGVHPHLIIQSFRSACKLSIDHLNTWAIDISEKQDPVKRREMLIKCAATSMNSKLIANQKEFFAPMVVDAVLSLDDSLPLDMIGIKKVHGGGLEDSFYVRGVAFKKTFSYAGFEQQPKRFTNPLVAILSIELELKAEKDNAEVRIDDPSMYQSIVDAEWSIIYEKLDKIVASGAQVVLSRLAIGDLATQYFADRGIFCAGRVEEPDLKRVAKACGGTIQSTVNGLGPEVLGKCAIFEERALGAERYNIFEGCTEGKAVTILLRGGAQQFLEECDRSVHDAVMIVRRAIKNAKIVPGGGAIEMELSKHIRDHAHRIFGMVASSNPCFFFFVVVEAHLRTGKQQLIVNAFAKALEIIPQQLCDNAGCGCEYS